MTYREEYERRLRGKSLVWWLVQVVPDYAGLAGVRRAWQLWRHYRRPSE
jgi:hypothetical protein